MDEGDDRGAVSAAAWRCADCGYYKLRQDDEPRPAACVMCGGTDIESVHPINAHGRPMALTASGKVVLGERRRGPRA